MMASPDSEAERTGDSLHGGGELVVTQHRDRQPGQAEADMDPGQPREQARERPRQPAQRGRQGAEGGERRPAAANTIVIRSAGSWWSSIPRST
jgi:hypothetical protein